MWDYYFQQVNQAEMENYFAMSNFPFQSDFAVGNTTTYLRF